jgi:hypothetical protein
MLGTADSIPLTNISSLVCVCVVSQLTHGYRCVKFTKIILNERTCIYFVKIY